MNGAKYITLPFELRKPISGEVIAKVLKKNYSINLKGNDLVIGNLRWQ